MVPTGFELLGFLKEWRRTPSEFSALPVDDQAAIIAFERTRARLDAVLASTASKPILQA